eukprot:scaffold31869_cov62-Phaeocystis_antarctica.AAC.1
MAHRVRVRRQLGALEDDRAELMICLAIMIFLHDLLGERDHERRDLLHVDLEPFFDLDAEAIHFGAIDDDEALLAHVDAALLLDQREHAREGCRVGGEDGDELVPIEEVGDTGRLAQRRHEDRLLGVLAGLFLKA